MGKWWTIWIGNLCVGDLRADSRGKTLALKDVPSRRIASGATPGEVKAAVALLVDIPVAYVEMVDMGGGRDRVFRAEAAQNMWSREVEQTFD